MIQRPNQSGKSKSKNDRSNMNLKPFSSPIFPSSLLHLVPFTYHLLSPTTSLQEPTHTCQNDACCSQIDERQNLINALPNGSFAPWNEKHIGPTVTPGPFMVKGGVTPDQPSGYQHQYHARGQMQLEPSARRRGPVGIEQGVHIRVLTESRRFLSCLVAVPSRDR